MPLESPFVFYPRYIASLIYKHVVLGGLVVRYGWLRKRLKRDPNAREYTDLALTPVEEEVLDDARLLTVIQ